MYNKEEFDLRKLSRILRRRQINQIQSHDRIFIPINISKHWVLIVINNKERCLDYYDSLGSSHADYIIDVVNMTIEALINEDLNYEKRILKCP